MTPTSKQAGRITESAHLTDSGSRQYMLTLCRIASPVAIRPPQSPHLKPFTFFTSRSQHKDGSERLYLHMGYFGTEEQAQKWARLLRGHYPQAVVSAAPNETLRQPHTNVPRLAPAESASLTDTQVMKVLTVRRAGSPALETGSAASQEVAVLRPEDTDTRRILKEAVVRGAPVAFAVQLLWSVEPIELASLPSLSIFRVYKLYKTESHREGRIWYCLRLGFFPDAISAKQVAYYVRGSFASVAVVPISEAEHTNGTAQPIDPSLLGDPARQHIDATLEADRPRPIEAAASAKPAPPPPRPAASSQPAHGETLEQTLEMLAASEIWSNPDSLSETGVRHLKIDVKK